MKSDRFETERVTLDGIKHICSRDKCLHVHTADASTIRFHMVDPEVGFKWNQVRSKFKKARMVRIILEKNLVGVAHCSPVQQI